MTGMTSNISPEAAARREAARVGGRFGEQEHTAPELALNNLHETEMAEGATRVMPLIIDGDRVWYDEETLDLTMTAAARHDVQGMVTRMPLPEDTLSPAARYTATLRSRHTGDSGRTFIYETGDQFFEKVTPSVAEVLAEAGTQANHQRGRTTEDGNVTAMDHLIAVVGEKDARDILAEAFLKNGESPEELYDDTYTVRHPAYKTQTGVSLRDAKMTRELWSDYLARYEHVEVINERTLAPVK